MGLDISHDGPHWSYSGFQIWRAAVVRAAGIPMRKHDKHDRFDIADIDFNSFPPERFMGEWAEGDPGDPLLVLIVHSDCDGVIHPGHALALAERIDGLMEKLEPYHAEAAGDFVAALRRAWALHEPLEFH